MNVLGLAELVSILERRAALLRDSPASDPGRTALQELVEWSYDLLHGDEKTLLQQLAVHRGGASLPSLVALAARHGLNEATVAYLVAALVDKSIVSASFTGGAARYDMLDTVREYVLERLAESGGLAAARGSARRILRGAGRRGARRAARAGMAALGTPPRAGERQSLGCAGVRSRRARSLPSRFGSARWGGTSRSPTASPRDGASSSSPSLRTDDDAPVELRIELLADLCYLATEEFDLGAALAAGERAVSLAATAAAPWQRGFAQLMLALALGQSGDVERAAAMADDAGRRVRGGWGRLGRRSERPHSRDRRGARAATSLPSPRRPRSPAVTRTRSDTTRFAPRRCCSKRGRPSDAGNDAAAVDAYRRAFELAGRIGFGDHAAFALAGLGAIALADGDLRKAEELQRQALATAEAAQAPWVAAHARVQLARIAAAAGDADEADRLYREVLEWSTTQRPHQARESLFVALAGNPATAAERGLAEIAEPAPTPRSPRAGRGAAAPGRALASALTSLRGVREQTQQEART